MNKTNKSNLHRRNKHRNGYDFDALVKMNPTLKSFVITNEYGNQTINFFDAQAVKALNKSLLQQYYSIKSWDLPKGFLCPPVPGRADYIHYIADLIAEDSKAKKDVRCLDIGIGSNCIYPIIGVSEYNWSFVGSEINTSAIENCQSIIEENEILKGKVEVRYQADKDTIFKGVVKEDEYFDIAICNPPFHASAEEAESSSLRKVRNLKGKDIKHVRPNFAGKNNELWYEGGELEFIKNIIYQSRDFKDNFGWISTLVSKKDNLKMIYKALRRAKASKVETIEMGQGNKVSRIVAWKY